MPRRFDQLWRGVRVMLGVSENQCWQARGRARANKGKKQGRGCYTPALLATTVVALRTLLLWREVVIDENDALAAGVEFEAG